MTNSELQFDEQYYLNTWLYLSLRCAEETKKLIPPPPDEAEAALANLRQQYMPSLRLWRRNHLNTYGRPILSARRLNAILREGLPIEPCRPMTFQASGGSGLQVHAMIIGNYLVAYGTTAIILRALRRSEQMPLSPGERFVYVSKEALRFAWCIGTPFFALWTMAQQGEDARVTAARNAWAATTVFPKKLKALTRLIQREYGMVSDTELLAELGTEMALLSAERIITLEDVLNEFALLPDRAANAAISFLQRGGEIRGRGQSNRAGHISLDSQSATGESLVNQIPSQTDFVAELEERSFLEAMIEAAQLSRNEREILELCLNEPELLTGHNANVRLSQLTGRPPNQIGVEKSRAKRKLRDIAEQAR